jgi:hypothetical protein
MSYTITRTDGSIFAVIPDGTVNNQSSMVLVGKNYAGYGAFLDENFLHLLENGSSTTAPTNPQEGQLWWDKTNKLMKVYTGSVGGFKTISSATASPTAPTSNVVGDLWFNTTSLQLSAWNGTSFTLIGPASSAAQGTSGALVNTIVDTGNVSHVVLELYTGNVLVATVSNDAQFSPAIPITGFANIRPGVQLATGISNTPFFQGTATNADLLDSLNSTQFLRSDEDDTTSGTLGILNDSGLRVGSSPNQATFSVVTANGEARIDNVVSNANLAIRANVAGTATDTIRIFGANGAVSIPGAFSVTGNSSLSNLALSGSVVGNLTVTGTITAASVSVPNVAAPGANTQVIFNDQGVSNAASTFTVVKSTGNVTVGNLLTAGITGLASINSITHTGANGVGNIGSSTSRFGTVHADFVSGLLTTAAQTNITSLGTLTTLSVSGAITGTLATAAQPNITSLGTLTSLDVTGAISLGSITKTGSNGVGNIGSSTNSFNVVFARATSAQYADVAERFAADAVLEPGTVVELGGTAEITRSQRELSEDVFGVISTRPAHLMNDGVGNNDTHPPVAMTGRVPVKVIGAVRKGDRLVSAGHGLARAATSGEATSFNVIGRSLQDKLTDEQGMIEAIVTIKN